MMPTVSAAIGIFQSERFFHKGMRTSNARIFGNLAAIANPAMIGDCVTHKALKRRTESVPGLNS